MAETSPAGDLARRVDALPALPAALTEVARALGGERLSANRAIALIEQDQALAGRTLRLANSAFYGVPGRVASIGDAVRLLGLRTVAGVLTAAAMHDLLRVDACPAFRFQVYWRHAIGTALAARALAPAAGHDADEAFLAGLMHDIGQLVLAAFDPLPAGAALALARADDLPAASAEQAVLGLTHPLVGALVAEHWQFPRRIADAIGHHHAPLAAAAGDRVSLSALVQMADAITHALDLAHDDREAVPALAATDWQALGLAPDAALRLFDSVERGAGELSRLLHSG